MADQAASDLAVGLALGAASLGIGAGGRGIAQPGQDDQVQGLVELAVAGAIQPHPRRLAAGGRDGRRTTEQAKAASLAAAAGMGPGAQDDGGHDRATPQRLSSSGRQAWTRVVMARVWSAISRSRSWLRRARARRLAAVAMVSESKSAPSRSRPQALTRRGVVRPPSRPRRVSGAATTRGWSWRWASVVAWTAERLAVSRTWSAARWPVARAGRAGHGQGLAGRPGRIQGVGLGAVAAGGPLGPVQRHHLLLVGSQEPGQAGAVAPVPSIAHTRRPSCRSASRSSCW